MEAIKNKKIIAICECGALLTYKDMYRTNEHITRYFDCFECDRRFKIKYNNDGVEVDRKCIGKAGVFQKCKEERYKP